MKTIEITARAKAFSHEGIKTHKFRVYADDTVRVWDPVAGYFTVCNSLSKSAEARIRKIARNSQKTVIQLKRLSENVFEFVCDKVERDGVIMLENGEYYVDIFDSIAENADEANVSKESFSTLDEAINFIFDICEENS